MLNVALHFLLWEIKTNISNNPQSECGKDLQKIITFKNFENKELFIIKFKNWEKKYFDFLKERSFKWKNIGILIEN